MRGRARRWTGPNSSMVNRDRRDQAFARSVIAEATRRHNMSGPTTLADGAHAGEIEPSVIERFRANHWKPQGDRPLVEGVDHTGSLARCQHPDCIAHFRSSCCTGNDPACPTHGIAASNARQNDYWRSVGGHPDAGDVDYDKEYCAFCNAPLDCDPEPCYPYCSTQCAIDAERS